MALLLLPSFVFLAIFTVYPILRTIGLSFFQQDMASSISEFVGLGNFLGLWHDALFWKVVVNTFYFVMGIVPISLALAIIMAMMANRVFRGNRAVQAVFFYPVVLPLVAVANIWLYLYSPNGLFSAVLAFFRIFNVNPLADTSTVIPALIVMLIWKDASFYMIFYLAAFKNLPEDVYEAAALDGAHGWRLFWRITFPLLMPTTVFCVVMATADSFHLIDHLIIMTQGGPNNASNTLLYYTYQNSFQFLDPGKASALTAVLLVILLIIFGVQFLGLDRKITYA
ncbi:carbohydrate ABC transporter permease [Propionibacterium sp.]|uniref:carbohydrate ABC transporter permease n=1 Tax=Propionibacterium sp. TaxID=1977903 RepID=UPI0039E77984